jgi:hypothetical protein
VRALRRLLKKTPLYYVYKSAGHYPDYWYWLLRDKPTRIPHIVKQRTVIDFGTRYCLRILIETGTYYGEMVSGTRGHFARIVSIEFDPKLAATAQERFKADRHIQILQGSSEVVLQQVLVTLSEPALFWLDAGYFLWAGEHKTVSRLMTELDSIFRHNIPNHIVLIDDVVSWSGRDGTPEVTELERDIAQKYPERKITVESGLMCVRHADFL